MKELIFKELLKKAIVDMLKYGYSDEKRLDAWMFALKTALTRESKSDDKIDQEVRDYLTSKANKATEKAEVKIERFTIEKVKPELRAELDRRIKASADLIKLNRDEMIDRTMRRFSGWSTSIPPGGSDQSATKARRQISKPLSSYSFEERRCLIDQGHKLVSNVNDVIAVGGGAIAAKWHSRWRDTSYDYRQDHKDRDEKIYLIKGSWAHDHGLVKPVDGYTDDITKPAQEINCMCSYGYIYSLRKLPKEMLTKKGEDYINARS